MRLFCFVITAVAILVAGAILLIDLWKVVDWSQYHYRIFWTCGVVGAAAFGTGVAHATLLQREQP